MFFKVILIIFAFMILLRAQELKFDLYNEFGGQNIDEKSVVNKNNMRNLNEAEFYTRGAVTAGSGYQDSFKALIKVEGIYSPLDFNRPTPTSTSKKDKIYIKAGYVDFLGESLSLRAGKQFVSWGSGTFFSPLDIINYKHDYLRPLDEAEGNSFLKFSLPAKTNFMFELYAVVDPENYQEPVTAGTDGTPERSTLKKISIIPKIGGSLGKLSCFTFVKLQEKDNVPFGFNLNYVFALGDKFDTTFFAESLVKRKSDIRVVEETNGSYHTGRREKQLYPAFLIGTQNRYNFTTTKMIDGISLNFEYYYNKENWNKNEFSTFYNASNTSSMQTVEILSLYQPFKSARSYFFMNMYFHSLLKKDFKIGSTYVMNLEDYSNLIIPDANYTFANQNAQIGAKSFIYLGKNNSEFGNYPVNYQCLLYTSVSF